MCSLLIVTGFAGQISLGPPRHRRVQRRGRGRRWRRTARSSSRTMLVAGLVGAAVAFRHRGARAAHLRAVLRRDVPRASRSSTGTFLLNAEYFPWLVPAPNVRILRPVIFNKFDLESEYAYYYFVLVVFAAVGADRCGGSARRAPVAPSSPTVTTRAPRRPTASARRRVQLTAFALSGFIAGIAGSLYVFHQHRLSDTLLQAESSMLLLRHRHRRWAWVAPRRPDRRGLPHVPQQLAVHRARSRRSCSPPASACSSS